jgi:DNA polymerase (family 10)
VKLGREMTNLEIAELLRDVAASYKLKDEKKNFFKVTAYERAADAVEHAASELKDLWDDGKLEDVPGVGPSIAEHLGEIFKTGRSKHFEEVMKGIPPEAFKLMELPGIGIKTAMKTLKEGSEKEIKEKLKLVAQKEGVVKRHLLPYADSIASQILEWMRKDKNVKKADPLGSLRRRVPTVGDIDIAASSVDACGTIEHFCEYPNAKKVLERGVRTASIILPGDIQVDLMVESPEGYGSLLQHFTGSKHHNIALRELALKKGYSLSDYGVKKSNSGGGNLKKFGSEENLYNFFGLDYIEPEMREDSGEIELACIHKLPKLVGFKEVKADLQIHSSFDIETSHDLGESSMSEIVKRAGEKGYEYLAFTEHNPSQRGHTDKDIIEILKRKREAVEQLNYSGVQKVFNSLEIDILPDGRLPVPEEGMQTLDFALVSIHSSFNLDRSAMTKRVLSALAHPKVKVFAHPTARKLNEREGVELDWPEIFSFCVKNNKWIEINCDPMRLDLPDNLVREAVKAGVKLTLGTDAHHKDGLDNMPFGVSVARRGWATAGDIINTRSLLEFERLLKEGD